MATRKKTPARKKKTTARKAAGKKATRKKTSAGKKKTAAKKTTTKKVSRKKKSTAKKATKKKTARKTARKKTTTRKKVAKKKAAKKSTARKATRKKAAPKARRATTTKKGSRRRARAVDASPVTGPVPGIDPYDIRSGEEYMNDDQRAHFRDILRAWKADLMQEVDRTVHHMKDDAANFPDPNDRATQESEFSLELRTRDRERKLIKKIDEAIATLDSGDYGYCESCGVEIGIRRLEARPTATLCIDCKTLDEIREKQMRA